MEIILFSILFISILGNVILFAKLVNREKALHNIKTELSILKTKAKITETAIEVNLEKIKSLEEQNSELLIFKGRFSESQQNIISLKSQLEKNRNELDIYKNRIMEFEKQNSLLDQEKKNLELEKEEWSSKKQTILFQLSEELIKKNNMQQDSFGKKQKEIIEETILNLNEKFSNILNKVSSLDDDVKKTCGDINFTKNALLSPGGAGRVAEITLENILKSSGLRQKKDINDIGDYITQSHFVDIENIGKRPDAMVFMPNNHILIIDSKSSSHFLELQQAIDDNDSKKQKEVEIKLKESMRKHLEDLKKKDYANSKKQNLEIKNLINQEEQPMITTIMFLQTEKMLETIRDLDSNFERKALENKILVLSPAGLINTLYQARFFIDNSRQEKNIEQLRIEIRKLIESIGIMFKSSAEMGGSITKSLKTYNKFVGTFNTRFLSRVSNMKKLGIKTENNYKFEKLEKINLDEGFIEIQNTEEEKKTIEV